MTDDLDSGKGAEEGGNDHEGQGPTSDAGERPEAEAPVKDDGFAVSPQDLSAGLDLDAGQEETHAAAAPGGPEEGSAQAEASESGDPAEGPALPRSPVSQAVLDLSNAEGDTTETPQATQVTQPKVKKLGQAHETLWHIFAVVCQVFLLIWVVGSFVGNRPYNVTGLILALVVILLTFPKLSFLSAQTKGGLAFLGTSIAFTLTAFHNSDVSLLRILPIPLVWAILLLALWVYVFASVYHLFWANHRKLAIVFMVLLLYPVWGLLASIVGSFSAGAVPGPDAPYFSLPHLNSSPQSLSFLPWFLTPSMFFNIILPLAAAVLFFRYAIKVILSPGLSGRHFAGLFLALGCVFLVVTGFIDETYPQKAFESVHKIVGEQIPDHTLAWRTGEVYTGDQPAPGASPALTPGAESLVAPDAATPAPEAGAAPPEGSPPAASDAQAPAAADGSAPAAADGSAPAAADGSAPAASDAQAPAASDAQAQADGSAQAPADGQAPAAADGGEQGAAEGQAQAEGPADGEQAVTVAGSPVADDAPEGSPSVSSPGEGAGDAAALGGAAGAAAAETLVASAEPGAQQAVPSAPTQPADRPAPAEQAAPPADDGSGGGAAPAEPGAQDIIINMPHIQPGTSLGPDTTIYFDKEGAPSPFYFDDTKDPSLPTRPPQDGPEGSSGSVYSDMAMGPTPGPGEVPTVAADAPLPNGSTVSAGGEAVPTPAPADAPSGPPGADATQAGGTPEEDIQRYIAQNEAYQRQIDDLNQRNQFLSEQLVTTRDQLSKTQEMFLSLQDRIVQLEGAAASQAPGKN
ncbi:MAG: hypothetical protein LBF40_05315 [Deltaproteobacteria bacterium]|nr:hypothetical protein [Deltaproteobacteria bacterium]